MNGQGNGYRKYVLGIDFVVHFVNALSFEYFDMRQRGCIEPVQLNLCIDSLSQAAIYAKKSKLTAVCI